jgi:hypothetical protein
MCLPGVDRLLDLTMQLQCFSSVFFAFQFIIHIQNQKKSLNWNPKIPVPAVPKLRIPQSLSVSVSTLYLFLSAVHDSSSSFTTALAPHRRRPFHQPPWEPESTQQQRRLSSLHQVSYSVHLVSLVLSSLLVTTSGWGCFFSPVRFLL